jgi:hypothetical protein
MKNVQAKVLEVIALYGVPTTSADIYRICKAQSITLAIFLISFVDSDVIVSNEYQTIYLQLKN